MPQLIKKVEGEVFDLPIGEVKYIKSVTGEIQGEDYINMNGIIAFLQDFSKIEETTLLINPINFGLKNRYNTPTITLYIDY